MKKDVLLITTTNLTCNPRCWKEALLLQQRQYRVTVLAFDLHNWSAEKEKALQQESPGISFHYIDTAKKPFISWLLASMIEKAAAPISALMPGSLFWASMAAGKRSWQLLQWIKKNNPRPSLVIAHNPAAFYPAYRLAKQNHIPFALDVEDYHPGETIKPAVKKSLELLLEKLVPEARYTSYAAPLIKAETEKLLKGPKGNGLVVNNFFPGNQFAPALLSKKDKIQLVWFSQNIDKGRGLEQLVPALDAYSDSIHLTLIGNPKKEFCDALLKDRKGITLAGALHPTALIKAMTQFDVGLATEPGKDLNNNLALSNKILTYFQAGLYILASDTPAQRLFMQQHPAHGLCTALTAPALGTAFEYLVKHQQELLAHRANRFQYAADYNWENEAAVLVKEWEAATV